MAFSAWARRVGSKTSLPGVCPRGFLPLSESLKTLAEPVRGEPVGRKQGEGGGASASGPSTTLKCLVISVPGLSGLWKPPA